MQSSFRSAALPAMRLAVCTILGLSFAASATAGAQAQLTVGADARARAGGPVVANVVAGARVTVGTQSGALTAVTFEGWVDAARLGGARDSFPASVSGRLTLRMRAQPNAQAPVVAVLQPGAGVHNLGRQGTWARVRRTAWVPTSALGRVAAESPAAKAPVAPQRAAQPAATPTTPAGPAAGRSGAARAVVAPTGTRLLDLPVGTAIGGLTPGTSVEIVGRQSGWVRVRADGWVPEKDLMDAGAAAAGRVSAADLRADPQGMKGKVLQWDVEVMSLQIADPLRADLNRDEPYLLVRGPRGENAIIYLAVPPALLEEARAISPLTWVTVSARVRTGRSAPAGTPILDLLAFVSR